MTKRAIALGVLMITVTLVGCLGDETAEPGAPAGNASGIDHEQIATEIGEPIEMFHNHTQAELHTDSYNMEVVNRETLDVELGVNGYADFQFYEEDDEDLAFVAIDGDTRGGFKIVDVSNPRDMNVLGEYMIAGSGIQEVVVTPDGDHALMNVQTTPPTDQGALDCQVCIHVVDVSDRSSPELVSRFPVELLGTHNIEAETYDGDTIVYYTGQPISAGGANNPVGNYIGITQLIEAPTGAYLAKIGEVRYPDALQHENSSFPHDMSIEEHPLTGQRIMYASWWNGGAVTFDVSTPPVATQLDVVRKWAPSQALAIHQFTPEPRARDDRMIAWSAPEIGGLDNESGVIRGYDVTDPGDMEQISTWELPGNVSIPGRYIMSPHIVDANLDKSLLAVGHYHAGVWILDIANPEDPRHLGYLQPVGEEDDPYTGDYWWKKPNFSPDGYVPNVFRVTWKDDLIWVTERGTGFYVLNYTGPVPGPAAGAS